MNTHNLPSLGAASLIFFYPPWCNIRANQKVKDELHGLAAYTGDQVNLEPKHAPETVAERRALYERERASVTAFDYADAAGFAVVTVAGASIEAKVYSGTASSPFATTKLSS